MKMLAKLQFTIITYLLFITAACTRPTEIGDADNPKSGHSARIAGPYTWKPLKVGAGGWVVGMEVHPTEPNLVYARTDVSGAYRWNSGTGTWKQLVTASNMPASYVGYAMYDGVVSLTGAPSDPDIAYMAFRGQIFKSSDRGDNWTATTFGSHAVTMEANGPGRQEGERLGVDPHNSNIVYFASIAHQLWTTANAGTTWQKITAVPAGLATHGVNTVIFDKASDTTGGKTHVIYVTVDGVGVYKTTDAGVSWTNIAGTGPGAARYRDAEIGPDGTYYVACNTNDGYTGSVWKYTSATGWTNITPSGSLSYEDIAVNPLDANHLIVMRQGGSAWASTNQGSSWTTRGFSRTSSTIQWLGLQADWWLSVGELVFDPFDSGKLWFAEGFGVWRTKDLYDTGITWIAESTGIEQTCGNMVICPPGGKAVTAMWDVGAFYHSNPDAYNAKRKQHTFMSGWALDWCPADPAFIVGTFQDHTNAHPPVRASGYSTDGGQNWTTFPAVLNNTASADLTYGSIAVSANSKDNIVWLPSNDKLPYYTTDRGATWIQCSFTGITTSGVNQYYTARKPLCADRVQAGTFYFYHHLNGIFSSTNNGVSWAKVGNAPASSRWNAMMKTVPGQSQDIWFAEGKQSNVVGGLWRSTDGGATWSAIPGIQQAFSFGFGKSDTTGGYPTVFVTGVAAGVHGIYRSDDSGATWQQIGTFPLGIFDYVDDIDGDKDVFGKVYLAFLGSGFAYGEEN
ncbi:MAG: hypothetical protein ABW007_00580 [Chitinophagaceae bacterium]